MIADSPHDFAAATLRVLGDRELNHRLRVNGRAWVESNYAWQHVYSQVDHVYARLLG